jgi:hypothetical protein
MSESSSRRRPQSAALRIAAESRRLLGCIVALRLDLPQPVGVEQWEGSTAAVRIVAQRVPPVGARSGYYVAHVYPAHGSRSAERLLRVAAPTWDWLEVRAESAWARRLADELRARETMPAPESDQPLAPLTIPAPPPTGWRTPTCWSDGAASYLDSLGERLDQTIPAPPPTGIERAVQRYLDATAAPTLECAAISWGMR